MSALKRARAIDLAAALIAEGAGYHDIARELRARHGISTVRVIDVDATELPAKERAS